MLRSLILYYPLANSLYELRSLTLINPINGGVKSGKVIITWTEVVDS
jgi:hypothetical protein